MPDIELRPATPTDQEWKELEAGFGAALQRKTLQKIREAGNRPIRADKLFVGRFIKARGREIINETLRRLNSPFRLLPVDSEPAVDPGAELLAIFRLPTP